MNINFIVIALLAAGTINLRASADVCLDLANSVKVGSDQSKLKSFLSTQWNYYMKEYPEWATGVGYPGQNDRWTNHSLTAMKRRDQEASCQLKALNLISRSKLSTKDRINFDLAKKSLEREIAGQAFFGDYLPIDHLGGIHMGIADVVRNMPQQTLSDFNNILARIEKFPVLVEQVEAILREGMKLKVSPVKMFLSRVPSQFDKVLTLNIEDSPVFEPFLNIKSDLPLEQKQALKNQARKLIETNIYPPLKKLKLFLESEYIPAAREYISFSDMPNGKAWYAYLVKSNTTTELTPDEIHNIGISEVGRISKEMERIRQQLKFKGDLKKLNEFLLSDSQFFYAKKEDLLAGYRDIAKRIDPELPKLFKTLPRLPYGIREMPDYKAKEMPTAYYEGGSIEGGRAGYFVANTYDLKSRPKWLMEALTLHEAVPGHHFQISIAQELKDMPEIRKFGGSSIAFSEGWALYAESLGSELGLYKDLYSQYGQLSSEMWRAVRLVVDTGIHSKGWTREQAIDYFKSNIPKSQHEAEVEIDRYITWPGQALAYKIGELKFKELRKFAREELGEKFNLREFHDQILSNGRIPMDILETATREWISRVKNSKAK